MTTDLHLTRTPDALREGHARDPHRPYFHFCSPSHWLNDPNGLIFWRGYYHLFYQYNPKGAFHSVIHWGHARSRDLVHWEDLPVALTPDPGGLDAGGCWSGCAVVHEGKPYIFYTGVHPQVQILAVSEDEDLIHWRKHPANPVIGHPPPGIEIVGGDLPEIRDPWLWQADGRWYMLLGTGIENVGGAVLLYSSTDLTQWTYEHIFHSGTFAEQATIWECPNFFSMGGADVLLGSELPEARHTYDQLGHTSDQRFHPTVTGKTDHGPYYYAAQSMVDDAGRRLMWGWLKEGRSESAFRQAGWAGVMAIPRVLSVRNQRLRMEPAPELRAARGASLLGETALTVDTGTTLEIPDAGAHLEIEIVMAAGQPLITVEACVSQAHDERTRVTFDGTTGHLTVDTTQSSHDPETQREIFSAQHVSEQPSVTLRIFVDGSIIEVFADDVTVISARIYPTPGGRHDLRFGAPQGRVAIDQLSVWTMQNCWGDRAD